MEEDSSIEEKQEYLRDNILNKGYDANSFAEFLISKRGEESADIGTWSMEDLREAVKEFLENHKIEQNNDEKEEISKKEEENNIIETEEQINEDNENIIIEKEEKEEEKKEEKEEKKEEEEEKEDKEKKEEKKEKDKSKKEEKKNVDKKEKEKEKENNIESTLPPEIYGIVLPEKFECKELESTPLSSVKNLVITLSSPEKKEGGFFSKSYITYLITTSEVNLKVRRRYTDFVWFHQIILQLYPYIVVPSIPKKNKIGIDKFSDIFINKRMRYLEKFLNWLVNNPIIKNSQLLYDFVSIEEYEDFNKKKNEYIKMIKPINLIDFYAPEGIMNLKVDKQKEDYFLKIKNYNSNNEVLLNNLNFSIKQLKIQFDIFIQRVEDVQKKWEILFTNSTKNFEDANITKTYEKMSNLFTNWANSLKKQNTLVFVDVREYFKYVKNNFREMKNNIYNTENNKNEYYKFERNLISKKEDLFRKGDVTKWEFDSQEKTNKNILVQDKLSALFKMCAKDTDRCVQRKVYYGYHLNQMIGEYERIRNYCGILHKENQMNFCRKLSEINNEFQSHINENMTDKVEEKVLNSEEKKNN